jgi:hypothetical protein
VVCEDHKAAAFQHVAEVADGSHHRQELAIKGAVIDLGLVQLGGKEAQWPPRLTWPPLLDGGANVCRGRVCYQRNLCPLGGVD